MSQVSAENSNIAALSSALNRDLKFDAAHSEKAWHGAGVAVGVQVWRIEKLEVKAWPKEQYGQFYSGDCYIVLNTYKPNPNSERLDYNLHFWIGRDATQDEYGVVAYKTVELDDYLKDRPVQFREVQEHESEQFREVFPSLVYMDGGAESGFNSVKPEEYKPRLLQVKGKKNPRATNVKLHSSSLNAGDVFILDNGLSLYQWNGSKSSAEEKNEANKIARNIKDARKGKPTITILDALEDDDTFWQLLGGKLSEEPAAVPDQVVPATKEAILYQLSDNHPNNELKLTKLATGKDVKKSLLNSDDVFILDKTFQIYVYVGKNASKQEKTKALLHAAEYLKQQNLPDYTPITKVMEGAESQDFNESFN